MRRLISIERKTIKQKVPIGMQELNKKDTVIEGFSDASLGNMRGEKTQIGYIVSIKDDEGNICPVMGKSKVVKRITRSTLDAETLAMEEGLENGIWIGRIREEIYGEKVKVIGYTDSKNEGGKKQEDKNRDSIH